MRNTDCLLLMVLGKSLLTTGIVQVALLITAIEQETLRNTSIAHIAAIEHNIHIII